MWAAAASGYKHVGHSVSRRLSRQAVIASTGVDDKREFYLSYVAGAAAVLLLCTKYHETQNLGIAAAVGDKNAQTFLLHALEQISAEKGVQEAGLTTLSPTSKFVTTKFGTDQGSDESRHWLPDVFDCVVVLRNNATSAGRHLDHSSGIACARNTPSTSVMCQQMEEPRQIVQPQVDSKNRIALVHEGQLTNSRELRRELESLASVTFKSNRDAELIAELIGWYIEKGYTVPDAMKQALSRLDGSWALAVIDKEKQDEVIVAQNGSRLSVGIGEGKMYVATEPELFGQYTNRYIALQDGEFAIVRANDSTLDLSRTEQLPFVNRTTRNIELNPAPFEHWTLSEISEQPDALFRALGCGSRIAGDTVVLGGLDKNAARMLSIDNLTLVAHGSSLFAAQFGAKLMAELGSFDSIQAVESPEMTKKYISKQDGGVCVVSKSGEAKVSQAAAKIAKKSGFPVFSVVNAVGSQVAKITKVGAYLNAGPEHGSKATKVFSSQVAVLALLASWFAQYRDNVSTEKRLSLIQSLQRLPRCFSSALECRSQCKIAAQRMFNARHCFVLGHSLAEPVAQEGALLLTGLSHINAEGCSPGALRHGTMSLVEGSGGKFGRTPVILLILSTDNPDVVRSAAQQVRASGAYTIVITDDAKYAEGVADTVITIPTNGMLTALNAIVPLQLLSYELALLKGINPDEGCVP